MENVRQRIHTKSIKEEFMENFYERQSKLTFIGIKKP